MGTFSSFRRPRRPKKKSGKKGDAGKTTDSAMAATFPNAPTATTLDHHDEDTQPYSGDFSTATKIGKINFPPGSDQLEAGAPLQPAALETPLPFAAGVLALQRTIASGGRKSLLWTAAGDFGSSVQRNSYGNGD